MWVRLQPECNRPLMSAISATTKDEFIQVEKTERLRTMKGQCVTSRRVWEVISAEWESFHP